MATGDKLLSQVMLCYVFVVLFIREVEIDNITKHFLCRLPSTAAHKDNFVCLSVW